MTEEIQTPPPMVVTDSTSKEQTGAAVRDVLLLITAIPALIAVLGTRDVKQVVDYIASAEFAPVLGLLVGGGVLVWRQMITRLSKRKLITAAGAAPNDVAIVKDAQS